MEEKYILNTLEFNTITERVSKHAGSELGKTRILNLAPYRDFKTVAAELTKTNDALSRIIRKGSVTFAGLRSVDKEISLLKIGSSLNTAELLKIVDLLRCCERVSDYGRTVVDKDGNSDTDSLSPLFDEICLLPEISKEIERCIISEDEISDRASAALFEIRRKITSLNEQIKRELSRIVNSDKARTYLQDNVVTSRNGRYCVPVKSEYRSMIQGLVHDESQSGATLFIEPMSVVKMNNDMTDLFIEEKKEIDVILAKLSALVFGKCDELKRNTELLAELDFIMAKALFAKDYNCIMPEVNHRGKIDIRQGRHPLIDREKVVPIDISLDSETSMVVITGPNTGGKTVALKTVGLFVLMTMAGLLIPARVGTSISVFDHVFADIGDEQSIEQSLSTFSSHMVRIVDFMKNITPKSLVLFDELGVGTDPSEGAALALSILENLHERNVRCIATTHYTEIKLYALETAGVINASCEFDVDTLSPTYRLLMGVPGKSNAFAISKRLGLDEEIIERARRNADKQKADFENVIVSLESSKVAIMKEKEEITRYKEEIKTLREALSKKNENIDARKDEIIRRANEEAARIMAEAKSKVDVAIRNINKYGNVEGLEEQRKILREGADKASSKAAIKVTVDKKKALKPEDIREGMSVRIVSMGMTGHVTGLPNRKGEVYVNTGILTTQVKVSDLMMADEVSEDKPSKTGSSGIRAKKSMSVSAEINLIGMTKDEAMIVLDKYLDDAYLAHVSPVRIVHGKGSGILRAAVAEKLRRTKNIKSFRLGEYGEGDVGVTIAEFK